MKLTRRISFALIAAVSLGIAATVSSSAGNWPQWRGPDGTGISTEKNLPAEWNTSKNIKWKTPIDGRGHSSPIVWDNRIFVTTAIEGDVVDGAKAPKHMLGDKEFVHPDSVGANKKHTFKVIALNRDSGKILWQAVAFEGTPYDDRHRKSSYAASTPATDGKMVYAFFGSEGLYAYDFNGKLAWKADLGKMGTVGMGTGTSPIIFENLVIVQADEENGTASFIVAFDKKTGKEVWKTPRKVQVSWSTPLLVKTAKRAELIASGTESIVSYDPATGKELWSHKGVESNAIPSPVANSEMVYLVAGYPAKIAMAIQLGRQRRPDWYAERAVAVPERHCVRAVADSLWRLSLPDDRSRDSDVHRRQDRRSEVRRRPHSDSGDFHCFARRVRRQDPADERGWRHVHRESWSEARGHRHELRWRAGLCVAGDCRWTDLHSRREEHLLHRQLNGGKSVKLCML